MIFLRFQSLTGRRLSCDVRVRAEMRSAVRLGVDHYKVHCERRTRVGWKHGGDLVTKADRPASELARPGQTFGEWS